MKMLVTGAGGFLGQNVVDYFAEAGWQIYGVSRSTAHLKPRPHITWHSMELPDQGLLMLLREQRPDVLVHTASSAIVGQSMSDPLGDFEQSVAVWSHVIDAVRRSGISCRVILLSSAAVYGNPDVLPVSENHSLAPISPYGYHKRICEEIAEYYAKLYDVAVCSIRIFSAYGPGLRRQVIWDICQKALTSKTLELMGTGDESRDFIHAKDVARAIACIVDRGEFHAGIYNMASGVSTTIRDIANKVTRALGTGNDIVFTGQRRGGDPLYWCADISKLTALDFRQHIAIDEGLTSYVDWVLQERREGRSR